MKTIAGYAVLLGLKAAFWIDEALHELQRFFVALASAILFGLDWIVEKWRSR